MEFGLNDHGCSIEHLEVNESDELRKEMESMPKWTLSDFRINCRDLIAALRTENGEVQLDAICCRPSLHSANNGILAGRHTERRMLASPGSSTNSESQVSGYTARNNVRI